MWSKKESVNSTEDVLKKELDELKTTVAKEHEELPFENLASADGQGEPATTCTRPNPYNYLPLLPDQLAIRLVVLLPSLERHADIVCELCNSVLTKFTSDSYEALSYVWGDPTRRRPIIVSRQLFQATENLEMALRNLRHPAKPRVLWIDAICINQNNTRERNEQVMLMGHIYRCALRVIAWLGPESDTSGAAFQLMRNKPNMPNVASATPQNIDSLRIAFIPGLMGFYWLCQRPLFRRVWCIRELVLARTVDFQCGQHHATMNDFLWIYDVDMEMPLSVKNKLLFSSKLCSDKMIESLVPFTKLANLHRIIHFTLAGILGHDSKLIVFRSALDFLNLFQNWQCSNDRDRVFAFYSLAVTGCPDKHALHPNYSLSVAQVYIRFAVRYLQQNKILNILIIATRPLPGFVDNSATRELPSWVPDWRDAPRDGICEYYFTIGTGTVESILWPSIGRYSTEYDTCLGLEAGPLKFLHDFRTLCLDGVAIDTIEEIGPLFSRDGQPSGQRPQVLSTWEDIVIPSVEHGYPFTGETSYEAFWRTLQADLLHNACDGRILCRIPPGASDFPADWDDMQHAGNLAYPYGPMVGRRFFRTSKGLFGLAPASARVSDDVAVLFGGKTPFVLRPDGESHRVIGECYVHGIMDGEAVHRPRTRQFADLSDKEFHLI